MKRVWLRRLTAAGLALLLAAGSSAALAKSEGKGGKGREDDDDDRQERVVEFRGRFGNLDLNFSDLGEADWASRYILSLAARRVFDGYEEGGFRKFKPNQPVTRIEAITAAVRLMGLEDEAQAKKGEAVPFKDAKLIPSWAAGYVVVAYEHDLFLETETTVQPLKPADRLWATVLLVKALKLEQEAEAKQNVELPFKDALDIPPALRGYVAVAVERGLINGYDDKTFKPNKPVTRAELAALLDRTDNQLPDSQDTIRGMIAQPIANNKLVLQRGGETVTLNVDPNTFVFKGGVRATLADLRVGDTVKVRLYQNTVILIEVVGPAQPSQQAFTVTGLYVSSTLNSHGQLSTITISRSVYDTTYGQQTPQLAVYPVSPNVQIVGDPSLLIPGRTIELNGRQNVVEQITIK